MNKYIKFELIERILTGLITDGSYWLIDKSIYKWDENDQCFYSQSTSHVFSGFAFEDMNDTVYELVDYEVRNNE